MNITCQPGTIRITVQKPQSNEPPFNQERSGLVAYSDGKSSGLAILPHIDDDGETTYYSITHIASGLEVCKWWVATTEEEARKWVEALLSLADWTGKMPTVTASPLKLLRYAIVGTIYEISQETDEHEQATSA